MHQLGASGIDGLKQHKQNSLKIRGVSDDIFELQDYVNNRLSEAARGGFLKVHKLLHPKHEI